MFIISYKYIIFLLRHTLKSACHKFNPFNFTSVSFISNFVTSNRSSLCTCRMCSTRLDRYSIDDATKSREPAELWNAGNYSSYCDHRYLIYLKPIGIHMKCFDTEKIVFTKTGLCFRAKLWIAKIENKLGNASTDEFFFCLVLIHYF